MYLRQIILALRPVQPSGWQAKAKCKLLGHDRWNLASERIQNALFRTLHACGTNVDNRPEEEAAIALRCQCKNLGSRRACEKPVTNNRPPVSFVQGKNDEIGFRFGNQALDVRSVA